ncbi:MAG TPA: hypothetical protein VMR18_00290 [Candidatus Saccharimonadales bacterium]|nr:hypothetical protein [Candidatus Saccharimonadales bacterium]
MATTPSELFAADLDRFLIDTDKAMDRLGAVYIAEGLDDDGLQAARHLVEGSGDSFDVWKHISSFGSADLLGAIEARFIEHCRDDPITYEDTEPFLDYLDEDASMVQLILTMGDLGWQAAKLRAANLYERPYIITDRRDKGTIIGSWQTASGLYAPPVIGETILRVMLGDDKASSFEGLPANCPGYLLHRPTERRLASQEGSVPPRVKIVGGLLEIAEDLSLREAI